MIAPRGCRLVPYCEGRNVACPGFSGRETRRPARLAPTRHSVAVEFVREDYGGDGREGDVPKGLVEIQVGREIWQTVAT
jgi:hypothetical protein